MVDGDMLSGGGGEEGEHCTILPGAIPSETQPAGDAASAAATATTTAAAAAAASAAPVELWQLDPAALPTAQREQLRLEVGGVAARLEAVSVELTGVLTLYGGLLGCLNDSSGSKHHQDEVH
jgi:hypothetical protein